MEKKRLKILKWGNFKKFPMYFSQSFENYIHKTKHKKKNNLSSVQNDNFIPL